MIPFRRNMLAVTLLTAMACSSTSDPGPDDPDPLDLHYLADTLTVIVGLDSYSDYVGHGGGLTLTLSDTTFALDMVTLPPGPLGGDEGLNYFSKSGSWTLTDSTIELVADDTVLFRTLSLRRVDSRLRARFTVLDVGDPLNNRELLISLAPVAVEASRHLLAIGLPP